jgi:radical SAM protein (TIGR01212 family)
VSPNYPRPFTAYASYLKSRYGAKTYRVSVDAGFSCPNRGADRGAGGCSFCGSTGARSPYLGNLDSLGEQILRGLTFLRGRYGAKHFLLYFQAYSGTCAPAAKLKSIYDYALSLADFRELIVSTRPDCIDAEKADLLAEYIGPDRDVWVELGLQSAQDATLKRIRRGHGRAEFDTAFSLLRKRGIKIAVHLIFGLPGEDEEDIVSTLHYLAGLRPEGVKIHNLHILFGTPLYDEFLAGELTALCAPRHAGYISRALEILPAETIFMRFTCDTPSARLACPKRFPDKGRFLNMLRGALGKG